LLKDSEVFQNNLDNFNIFSLDIDDKYDNTYLLGIYAKYLNLDLEILLKKVEEILSKK
jgi:hypothetical protein